MDMYMYGSRPLAEWSVVAAASPASHCAAVSDAAGTHVLCANSGRCASAPRTAAACRRIAPAPARRARERPARRPLPSTSAPAVDHAAALWQLCCRIGRTTTVACQRVGSYARCHHLRPRATDSILGTNSRATQRAGELAAADPAYHARLARRLQLAARSRPEKLTRGAPFGVELERAIAHGGLCGRGAVRCAVRLLCDAQTTTSSANTPARRHPVFNTLRVS
eukprot:scaffold3354_cov63-Phaeocystis_antarctica.AAC.6